MHIYVPFDTFTICLSFEVLIAADALPCDQYLSSKSYSKIIFSSILMMESFILGVATTLVYRKFPKMILSENV